MEKTNAPTSDDVDSFFDSWLRNYPGFVEEFVQQYEEEYGIGLRARLRAAIAFTLSLPKSSNANDQTCQIAACLTTVLRLIEDKPEGIAILGPRLMIEVTRLLASRGVGPT